MLAHLKMPFCFLQMAGNESYISRQFWNQGIVLEVVPHCRNIPTENTDSVGERFGWTWEDGGAQRQTFSHQPTLLISEVEPVTAECRSSN